MAKSKGIEMKVEINAYEAKEIFKKIDRDKFSIEAIEMIFDYFEELGEENFDPIAVACDFTEHNLNEPSEVDEIMNLYGREGENIEEVLERIEMDGIFWVMRGLNSIVISE